MKALSVQTVALTTLISLASLMSTSAQAGILRTAEGVPVLTSGGNCVHTGSIDPDCSATGNEAGVASTTLTHEKSIYFNFNKSVLTPHAKATLDQIAKKLKIVTTEGDTKHHHHYHHVALQGVSIVGFADRIGNADYNEKLALKRAQAVRDYLVAAGVPAKSVEVRSLGKIDPVASCPADLPRAKLIPCLHEVRRVEIEFTESAK